MVFSKIIRLFLSTMKVKVLIIRFSSIGDIVLTSPIIRCLKEQLEGEVELHFITKKAFVPLLENNPHISKVYSIEKSTNEVIDELKDEDYDYIVDLHKNLRSARIKKALKALAFSFDKQNLQKWLLVNFKINRLAKKHIVDRYFDGIKALGIENDGKGLDYFFPESEQTFSIELNKQFQKYIVLVLGAKHQTKAIPIEKLRELLENIKSPVLLIGGKEDAALGEKLEQEFPSKAKNMAGKCNLHQSAFLLKHADKVISPDTGMMHIAAALKKEIISVWGNTVPAFGMYPYLPANSPAPVLLENKLGCRPCSKIGFQKCPKGHFNCMMQHDLAALADKL